MFRTEQDHRTASPGSLVGWGITLFSVIYATGLALLLLILELRSEWSPLLALLDAALLLLFAPALMLLPLALVARLRMASLAGVMIVAFFVVHYAPDLSPVVPSVVSADDAVAFTVMTFNLRYEYSEPDDLLDIIQAEGADIVALQELAPGTARRLHERLADYYPYRIPAPDAWASIGLLSRYPIEAYEWFEPAGESRAALHAILSVDGQPLHIFAVHPYPPGLMWFRNTPVPSGLIYGNRLAETTGLAERAYRVQHSGDLPGPVLILGDFNTNAGAPAYDVLDEAMTDVYRKVGPGLGVTFPHKLWLGWFKVPGPFARIDFIFSSPGLVALDAATICTDVSDHCAVTARLAVD